MLHSVWWLGAAFSASSLCRGPVLGLRHVWLGAVLSASLLSISPACRDLVLVGKHCALLCGPVDWVLLCLPVGLDFTAFTLLLYTLLSWDPVDRERCFV